MISILKSTEWGSPSTDVRGLALGELAAELDLLVLNRSTSYTCIRHNGGSIVDITMTSPPAARLARDWRVMEDTETLSDHRYIRVDVLDPSQGRINCEPAPGSSLSPFPRWAIKKMDEDAILTALVTKTWEQSPSVRPCGE